MKATVFGVIALSRAFASPKGMILKPGEKGPNPSREFSFVLNPTIVIVRP